MRDLLNDPTLRNASDVSHTVTAVASSSSKDRSAKFIADTGIPAPCAAYGSYEELVADPNVDVVYVATPHSHHFQNVMLAFEAGKHVLCEKAFTVNAAQAKILCETAKSKNLFLMEAVWTRYFPLSVQVRELIQKGTIGEVLRVLADNSFGDPVEETWGTKHRMVNKDLAGGCLLDCKFPLVLSYRQAGINRSFSGHLLVNLGVPNPIPHSPSGPAQTSLSCVLTHDSLPPHRRRRSHHHAP